MKATLIKDHFVSLELATQAGTYVKEFIHGDLGRMQLWGMLGNVGINNDISVIDRSNKSQLRNVNEL